MTCVDVQNLWNYIDQVLSMGYGVTSAEIIRKHGDNADEYACLNVFMYVHAVICRGLGGFNPPYFTVRLCVRTL